MGARLVSIEGTRTGSTTADIGRGAIYRSGGPPSGFAIPDRAATGR